MREESPKFSPVFVLAHWKCKQILFYDDWLRFIFLPVCKSHIDYSLSLCPILWLVTSLAIGSAINLMLTNQLRECVSVNWFFLLCEWHHITTYNCPNRQNLMGYNHRPQWDIHIIFKSDQRDPIRLIKVKMDVCMNVKYIRYSPPSNIRTLNDSNSKIIKTIIWPSCSV